jgi:hypothetical protein
MQRRLLLFMQDRERADIQEVCRYVWGKDYAEVGEGAFHPAVSRANDFLRKRQHPRHLEKVRNEPTLRWV